MSNSWELIWVHEDFVSSRTINYSAETVLQINRALWKAPS